MSKVKQLQDLTNLLHRSRIKSLIKYRVFPENVLTFWNVKCQYRMFSEMY